MFDITKVRAEESAIIELTTGEGAPLVDEAGNRLTVTIYGPASKPWRQADTRRSRNQASRAEKNPRKVSSAILDHRESDDLEFLVSITVSFNGWEYPHPDKETGGAWASDRDMFKAAYSDHGIGYIKDQLLKEGQDWSAFSKGGSTPSASTLDSSAG